MNMNGAMKSLVLMLALVLVGFMAGSAMAAGTASTDSITNGVFVTGDTEPQARGEVSVGYMKSSNSTDSAFKGPSSVAQVSVDTGYDLALIGTPQDTRWAMGETASYPYYIENKGNATMRIYIDSAGHPSSQGDSGPAAGSSNWNFTGSYKVYTDSNNDNGWDNGDTIVGPYQGVSNYIQLAAGASDTLVLAVFIPTDANDGETSGAVILVTNRAPIVGSSTTGDAWEDSVPIKVDDARDTQYDTTVTTVVAPNVFVDKTMSEETSGRSRPGDTLVINITFDNDGGDTARGCELMDAIPTNTRYVRNSADSGIYLGNIGQTATAYGDSDITVTFDTDAPGTELDFKDTEGHQQDTAPTTGARQAVRAIRWSLETNLGENNGDAKGTVNFADGVYDNGRVAYRVVIQ